MVVADLDEEQNFLKDVLGMRSLRARTLPNGAKQGFSGAAACSEIVCAQTCQLLELLFEISTMRKVACAHTST